ncbi:MAG TPA: cytochrome c family protein [Syntrophales bacterium]|nr:cytochrome c family protein [Syntrophales bacterium]
MAVERYPESTISKRLNIRKYAWLISFVGLLLVFGVIIFFYFSRYKHVSEGKFVGPGKCGECHKKQYESWKKTKMANSFKVLQAGQKSKEKELAGLDPERDYTRDVTCIPCHTTGYGLVGGFVSIEKTPEMAGVTCEACHGHGGTFIGTVMDLKNPTFKTSDARKAGLVYPPTENVCRMCHNSHSPFVGMDYKFDFKERVQLGTHEHFRLKYEHGK